MPVLIDRITNADRRAGMIAADPPRTEPHMARVSDVPPEKVPPDIRETYMRFAGGYGPFRNQVGVFAHVPSAVQHLMGLLLDLREQRNVPYRYIELAIVAVSKLNECHYC